MIFSRTTLWVSQAEAEEQADYNANTVRFSEYMFFLWTIFKISFHWKLSDVVIINEIANPLLLRSVGLIFNRLLRSAFLIATSIRRVTSKT